MGLLATLLRDDFRKDIRHRLWREGHWERELCIIFRHRRDALQYEIMLGTHYNSN